MMKNITSEDVAMFFGFLAILYLVSIVNEIILG